ECDLVGSFGDRARLGVIKLPRWLKREAFKFAIDVNAADGGMQREYLPVNAEIEIHSSHHRTLKPMCSSWSKLNALAPGPKSPRHFMWSMAKWTMNSAAP